MIIGLIIVAVCFYAAGHAIERARNQAWTGPRSPAMRTRAARPPRAPQGRARGTSHGGPGAWNMWNQAWSSNWLANRDHRRANGAPPVARPARQRQPLTTRLRLKPQTVTVPPATQPGNQNGHDGTRRDAPPARPSQTPPAQQQPQPAPTSSTPSSTSNGGTPMTSNAAGEKITEGANELHQHASSGGINAKMEALSGAEEGANRFSGTMEMLGRTMSEPDNRYGPEITEPIKKAGAQLRAAAILIGEGRANLDSLANMTLRDVAGSSRQAPHHSEMDENGSR